MFFTWILYVVVSIVIWTYLFKIHWSISLKIWWTLYVVENREQIWTCTFITTICSKLFEVSLHSSISGGHVLFWFCSQFKYVLSSWLCVGLCVHKILAVVKFWLRSQSTSKVFDIGYFSYAIHLYYTNKMDTKIFWDNYISG